MTIQQFEEQIAEYGLQEMRLYSRSCRILARLCLICMLVLLILLQSITFFVAVHAGCPMKAALIYALIPVLGPVQYGFHLVSSGVGSSLILLTVFVPYALTLLGMIWYYTQHENVLRAIENAVRRQDILPVAKINPPYIPNQPVPYTAVSEETQNEQAAPVFNGEKQAKQTGTVDTAVVVNTVVQAGDKSLSMPKPSELSMPPCQAVRNPSEPDRAAERQSLPDLKNEDDEYSRAMRDVLRLLNKNK